jgi:hypothetical protein
MPQDYEIKCTLVLSIPLLFDILANDPTTITLFNTLVVFFSPLNRKCTKSREPALQVFYAPTLTCTYIQKVINTMRIIG